MVDTIEMIHIIACVFSTIFLLHTVANAVSKPVLIIDFV